MPSDEGKMNLYKYIDVIERRVIPPNMTLWSITKSWLPKLYCNTMTKLIDANNPM